MAKRYEYSVHHLSFYPSHRVMTTMQSPCLVQNLFSDPAMSKIPWPQKRQPLVLP